MATPDLKELPFPVNTAAPDRRNVSRTRVVFGEAMPTEPTTRPSSDRQDQPTARPSVFESIKDEQSMERMVFFSDAVFAIVITLMALEIRLPQARAYATEAALRQALLELAPAYLAYIISFGVVGLSWLGHHRKFRFITHYDAILLRINLVMLMVVAVVPFMSSLLSEYHYRTVIVLYAGTMLVVALLSALLSWYALRRNLVERPLTAQERGLFLDEPLKVAGVFLLSIVLAQWNTQVAIWSWLMIVPATTDIRIPRIGAKAHGHRKER